MQLTDAERAERLNRGSRGPTTVWGGRVWGGRSRCLRARTRLANGWLAEHRPRGAPDNRPFGGRKLRADRRPRRRRPRLGRLHDADDQRRSTCRLRFSAACARRSSNDPPTDVEEPLDPPSASGVAAWLETFIETFDDCSVCSGSRFHPPALPSKSWPTQAFCRRSWMWWACRTRGLDVACYEQHAVCSRTMWLITCPGNTRMSTRGSLPWNNGWPRESPGRCTSNVAELRCIPACTRRFG